MWTKNNVKQNEICFLKNTIDDYKTHLKNISSVKKSINNTQAFGFEKSLGTHYLQKIQNKYTKFVDNEVSIENQILLKKMLNIENSQKVYPDPVQVQYYSSVNRFRQIKKTNQDNQVMLRKLSEQKSLYSKNITEKNYQLIKGYRKNLQSGKKYIRENINISDIAINQLQNDKSFKKLNQSYQKPQSAQQHY